MKGGIESCLKCYLLYDKVQSHLLKRPPQHVQLIIDVAARLVSSLPSPSCRSTPTPCHNSSDLVPFASCLALLSPRWPSALQLVLTFLSLGRTVAIERNEFHSPDRTVFLHLTVRGRKLIFHCLTLSATRLNCSSM